MIDSEEAMRVALHSIGVPVSGDWTIRDMSLTRDIEIVRSGETDVYGNEHSSLAVAGERVTVVLVRPVD